jgi:hypothetical protein
MPVSAVTGLGGKKAEVGGTAEGADFLDALDEVMRPKTVAAEVEPAAAEVEPEALLEVDVVPLLDVEQCSNEELLRALEPFPHYFVNWGTYFVNDYDCAVFAVPEMDDFVRTMEFSQMLTSLHADSCQMRVIDGTVVFSLWWD